MNKKLCLLLLALFYAHICIAQVVEGHVSNVANNERLPFTHVVNLTSSQGVLTDINGFYSIEAQQGDVLQFSYVGYTQQNITVGSARRINVRLAPDGYSISELAILPGVNPAHRIIENAVANRVRNNPENRDAFSCMVYNRLVADVMIDSVANPELFAQMPRDLGSYILMNEAVIRHEYTYNGNVSEHIVSSRTSSADEFQMLAFLQPTLQFFHFYNDVLEWKAPLKFFVNPISPGSTSKYFFMLRDTIVSGVDSTFIISFQPRRAANFDGLKGLLYINTDGWAIQNVVAEPADYSPTRLILQQSYDMIDGVWFPSELSLELFFNVFTLQGVTGVYRGSSRITDVDLSADLSDRTFRSRNITIADDAHIRLEPIERLRGRELTMREDSTYRLYGNILDRPGRFFEGITDREAIVINIFDFPLEKIFDENYFEGLRIGLGMYTNRHLSPWFSVGGYYGFGLEDRQGKYGASVSVFPQKDLDFEIRFWWENDLFNFFRHRETGVGAQKLSGKFDVLATFKVQELQSLFDYSYRGREMSQIWERNAEAGFMLRYAHREERIKMYRRTHALFTTHPIIYFNFFTGIPNVYGSKYNYIKLEAGAERSWHVRNLGTVTFSLWGGWMNNDVPFPMTFAVTDTEQSLFHTRFPDSRTSFNVLTGDVYAANQYFNAFLYHDFGTLLFKTQSTVFRPRIAVAQSLGWSKLNRPERHISPEINILDMQKGYFESGVMIEDVIRLELLKMFFFGIGGGVYGAYGGGVQKDFVKTLTPKVRVTMSF